ncbi:MAG: hypothetical protein P1V29_07300 [Gammaproteobacteria bacterium]|nr:hypothetical protein [Gammaproteobacteria bacterium]
MIVSLVTVALQLGIPMALLSWLLFMRFFSRGQLDRASDRKEIERKVKEFKTSYNKTKKALSKEGKEGDTLAMRSSTDHVFDKWMYFGSGFYGLAALWTLVVIEFFSLLDLAINLLTLSMFDDGIIAFLIGVATEQLGNLISAFLWFNYWDDSLLVSFLIAYVGYWSGVEAARRNLDLSRERLFEEVRRRIKR